ncbi:MAG: hypothetical protein FWG70_03960 [Oscillospiraceae bacterium]|nr:hypothetical protein [Oscillospiraceae bacterium]
MTNLDRLKMELGHKPYCEDDEYKVFLAENGLLADENYNNDKARSNLIETVICVLEMLSNNIDNYMKVETNFHTTSAALDNLHSRINHLHNRIKNPKEHAPEGDFSFMYHT